MAEAINTYNVTAIVCDPAEWRAQLAEWAERGWPVIEYPNTLPRMVPAWKEFYSAVMERRLTHDGDPGLARHVANAVLRVDQRGARPTKEFSGSARKIDRLIAALIAFDVARQRPAAEVFATWA
jgi:phage terminase large subunit-like protein